MKIQEAGVDKIQEAILTFAKDNGYNPDKFNSEEIAKRVYMMQGNESFTAMQQSFHHYTENGSGSYDFKFDRYALNYGDIVRWLKMFTRNSKPTTNQYTPEKPTWTPNDKERENQHRFTYLICYYRYYLEDASRIFCGWKPSITWKWIARQPFAEMYADEMEVYEIADKIKGEIQKQKVNTRNNNLRVLTQGSGGNMRVMRYAPNVTEDDIISAARLAQHYRSLEANGITAAHVLRSHGIEVNTGIYPIQGDKDNFEFVTNLK